MTHPYQCPQCGLSHEDPDTQPPSYVECKDVLSHIPGEELPGLEKWTEVHKCPDCGTVWEFRTSNY